MTTAEFKLKYPHLAHLKGESLWNAMEDSMLTGKPKLPASRTFEDIEQDQKEHPENWVTEKIGESTVHWPKSFVDMFADAIPADGQPRLTKMAFMMPSGSFDSDMVVSPPPPLNCGIPPEELEDDGPACRVCGCTEHNACYHPDHGACWWVESNLCSHCKNGWGCSR